MELDRQAIERRDFPLARRGYEPAAVDAHLRALAEDIERLRGESERGGVSLAANAGVHVQSIIEAAERAAVDMERQANEAARSTRAAAEADAARTRANAVQQAREHVAAVSGATASLVASVNTMDSEVAALIEQLRSAAGAIAAELARADGSIGELQSGVAGLAPDEPPVPALRAANDPLLAPVTELRPQPQLAEAPLPAEVTPPAELAPAPEPAPEEVAPPAEVAPSPEPAPAGADIDKARLVAVNMALSGQPREEAVQQLVESFQLPDAERLVDEVYAAIDA